MRHFTYKNLQELQQSCETLGTRHVQFIESPDRVRQILSKPVDVAGRRAGNSIAIHPMEGCDGTLDGRPSELTIRRYHRFAKGGAKLIWFEATAVREDGRANARQLWITPGNLGDYARLLDSIREYAGVDCLVPIQLTHSGRYSVPSKTIAYHNPLIDHRSGTPADYPVVSDGELERLEDDYVEAAKLAWKAGFRELDLKITHGYLLAELMGAKVRGGQYGGSIENRTRFGRNVLGKIRAALGRDMLLGMRLGCFDGVPYRMNEQSKLGEPYEYETPYPHGFGVNPADPHQEELTEVKQAIQIYRDAGLELLNVSIGCPYYNPHIGRPFESPDEGSYEQPEHPLYGVDRHFRIAGELQRAFPGLPMVGTGYSWLQVYAANAAANNIANGNITFFGYGRGALAFPEFAHALLEHGTLDERRVCKTLTYCTFLMRQKAHPLGQWPTGCPPFDKEVYGPIMKEARAVKRGLISINDVKTA